MLRWPQEARLSGDLKKSNLSVPNKSIRVTSSPSPSTRLLDVLQRQLFALTNYLPKTLKAETEKSKEISLEPTARPFFLKMDVL